jgi:hypothetical protein
VGGIRITHRGKYGDGPGSKKTHATQKSSKYADLPQEPRHYKEDRILPNGFSCRKEVCREWYLQSYGYAGIRCTAGSQTRTCVTLLYQIKKFNLNFEHQTVNIDTDMKIMRNHFFAEWFEDNGVVYSSQREYVVDKVWPAFKAFYERNQHLRIPRKTVVNGVNLGEVVKHIRSQKCFLQHTDFIKWLHIRGFVYDEIRAHLEGEVWPAFKAFFEENGHLHIPTKKVVNGVNLGTIVHNIRIRKCFMQYEDFAMWLWCGGFEMHTKDVAENSKRWNNFFAEYPKK